MFVPCVCGSNSLWSPSKLLIPCIEVMSKPTLKSIFEPSMMTSLSMSMRRSKSAPANRPLSLLTLKVVGLLCDGHRCEVKTGASIVSPEDEMTLINS